MNPIRNYRKTSAEKLVKVGGAAALAALAVIYGPELLAKVKAQIGDSGNQSDSGAEDEAL